jgi:hypothetical protein
MPDPPMVPHLLLRPLPRAFVSPCWLPDVDAWARGPPSSGRRPHPDRKGPRRRRGQGASTGRVRMTQLEQHRKEPPMNQDRQDAPFPPREDADQLSPGYQHGSCAAFDPHDLDPEKLAQILLSDFPENILHDRRKEMRIVYDSEEEEVMAPVVEMAAALIFQAPSLLVNYPLSELFTRVKHCLDRPVQERVRRESTTMPTFADIRRQVHAGATDLLGREIDEQALRGCCAMLAAMVIKPSKLRADRMYLDVPEYDDIIKYTGLYFAEELALLKEACRHVDQEAVARGLRGSALAAWCVRRLNTEFIGWPSRRRARHVKRRR